MPRVFHITCTKTMEATVLAESADEVRKAILLEDIDGWDSGPDCWDVSTLDAFESHKRMGKFPAEVEADMFLYHGRIYEWGELEDFEEAKEMLRKAEEEMKALAVERLQMKLPL